MAEKKNKTGLIIGSLAIGAAATAAAYAATCYKIFTLSFVPETSIFKKSQKVHVDIGIDENKKRNEEWFNASSHEDVFIHSYDDLKLHAVIINNHPKSHRWYIRMHGYMSYGTQLLDSPYAFDAEGYNCLLPDNRAFGLSQGKYTGLGWCEHYDLLDWINYVINIDPDAEIVLHGISMGASAVMDATGEFLPSNVKCAISDCGYSSLVDLFKTIFKSMFKFKGTPFIKGLDEIVKRKVGFSMYEANCRQQLQQSNTPTLFIHGEADSLIPLENVFENYYACASEKELFTVEDANHAVSFRNKNYYPTVFAFTKKYVK